MCGARHKAHARRKYFDLHETTGSPQALYAPQRIGELYDIERAIRGKPAEQRQQIRREQAAPRLQAFKHWMDQTLAATSAQSDLGKAILYSARRRAALTRYADDGRLEIDNSAAERVLRCVALGRHNSLFVGSDAGGERAATMYSLIGTAKLDGMDPTGLPAPRPRAHRRASGQPCRRAAALERGRPDRARRRCTASGCLTFSASSMRRRPHACAGSA